MKKKIKIVVLLLIVISVIGFIAYNCLNYSQRRILSLLEKGGKNTNYTSTIKSGSEVLISKKKDNVIYISSEKQDATTYIFYLDNNNDKVIFADDQYAIVTSISKYLNEQSKDYFHYTENDSAIAVDQINSGKYDCKFLGSTTINGEACIKIELNKKDGEDLTIEKPENITNSSEENQETSSLKASSSSKVTKISYTISKKTGMVLKCIEYDSNGTILDEIDIEYNLNTVTDADVSEPDLSGRKIYNL